MGTTWRVQAVSKRPLAEIRTLVEQALASVVQEMSHWEASSHLSRFNAAPVGTRAILPPDFGTVMACALQVHAASGGAFDPAAGELVDLWGFGPPGPVTAPPTREAIAAAFHPFAVKLDGPVLTRSAPVRLDLSGIAKGAAVDLMWRALAQHEVTDALIEIGGELRGEGLRPDAQPWWVEMETPAGHPAAPIRLALHGLCVATSGDYVRNWRHAGRRYSHTLDPRTGRPVDNGVTAVSVVAPDAMTADAWATALHVIGPRGLELADARGLGVRMLMKDGERLSATLEAMLDS